MALLKIMRGITVSLERLNIALTKIAQAVC